MIRAEQDWLEFGNHGLSKYVLGRLAFWSADIRITIKNGALKSAYLNSPIKESQSGALIVPKSSVSTSVSHVDSTALRPIDFRFGRIGGTLVFGAALKQPVSIQLIPRTLARCAIRIHRPITCYDFPIS